MTITARRPMLYAAAPVAVVAAIAGIQSYNHIVALALRTHQNLLDSRLLPFSIDGLIVAGVVIVLAGYWLGWLSVALGVAATVFANIESGLPFGPLPAAVAAWPAIAFSVASYVLERWLKAQVSQDGHAGQDPARCAHQVAGSAAEAVTAAFLHGRDCLGRPPSQRHLAASFGLHRTKVAELVGSLNGHHPPPQDEDPPPDN